MSDRIKLNLEATGGLDGSMKTFVVDTTINQGDDVNTSTTEKTAATPPEVLNVE